MSSPEDKARKRNRIKNKWAKELKTAKYKKRVVEDKKKKVLDVKNLTHADLVRLIQEDD